MSAHQSEPLSTDARADWVARPAGFAIAAYFSSGWAFLLPYLSCYLLYAGMRWPVNPGSGTGIPALLHVFWCLHLVHLLAAFTAARSQVRAQGPTGRGWRDLLWPLAPWACLALILYIPGAYLEFPADPWAHLSRITEWAQAREISHHSVWEKSSYFTAYSLVGWLPKRWLQEGIDIYQAACGLLLAWNYYRLGRQVGLGRPAAQIFALLQAVLLGNTLFTFLRYYGLSSTLFSQLAAVAMVRVALHVAPDLRPPGIRYGSALLAMGLLAGLIHYNHVQGLPLAAIGVAAVGLHHLLARRPSAGRWLLGAAVAGAVAAIVWWPLHPSITELYRPAGWIGFFQGFNLLSPSSPAFERAMQILGLAGGLNLVAGVVLLRRNHVAGWLTVLPVLALLHPAVALPLFNYFAAKNPADVVIFHRLLFAIPPGLALVAWGEMAHRHLLARPTPAGAARNPASTLAYVMVIGTLFAGVTLSPAPPWCGRLWNAVAPVPDDLSQRAFQRDAAEYADTFPDSPLLVVGSSGLSSIFNAYRSVTTLYDPLIAHRLYHFPRPRSPAGDLQEMQRNLPATRVPGVAVLFGRTTDLTTPQSTAAVISRHWLPQEVALATAGRLQLLSESPGGAPGGTPRGSSFDAFPAGGDFAATLHLAPGTWPGASEGSLQTASLPQLPAIENGTAILTARLATPARPWANLLVIATPDDDRAIYLYARAETGELYYRFFGQTAGPFPSPIAPGQPPQTIEFKWSDGRQEIFINQQPVAHSSFAVPAHAHAREIRIGWLERGDEDCWPGTLSALSITFGP